MHLAGWKAGDPGTILTADNGLMIEPLESSSAGALVIDSPYFPAHMPTVSALRFQAVSDVRGRLFWRSSAENFSDTQSTAFSGQAQSPTDISIPAIRPQRLRIEFDSPTLLTLLELGIDGEATLGTMGMTGNDSAPTMTPTPELMDMGQPSVMDIFAGRSTGNDPRTKTDAGTGPTLHRRLSLKQRYLEGVRYASFEGGCTHNERPFTFDTMAVVAIVLALGLRRRGRTL